MEEWKEYVLSELIDEISMGPFGSNIKVECFTDSGVPVLNGSNLVGLKLNEDKFNYVTEEKAASLGKANAYRNDIVITHRGTLGQIVYIPQNSKYDHYVISQSQFRIRCNQKVLPEYLVYYFHTRIGQHQLLSNASQVGVPALARPTTTFQKLRVVLPPLPTQQKIAAILSSLDDKIELNNKINTNLEQQAQAIFKSLFVDGSEKSHTIGDYIVPKRGKNLLSKDAILGDVPVVAGGLEPATYHNSANTKPPVLTISASGANAGFVNLWNIPVWSSDSSFIDLTMTKEVYFWYVLLKLRQKEIFDSQTGSAQPHIYPQHISVLPIAELDMTKVSEFTKTVTPLFKKIGENQQENRTLTTIRDTLLPKLMNGEIEVDSVQI